MRAKVLKSFRDKYNQKVYKVGEILNISKKRYEEILKVDKLIEKVEEEKKENE